MGKKAAGCVRLPFPWPKIVPEQQDGVVSDTVLDPNISNTSSQEWVEKSAPAASLGRAGAVYEMGPVTHMMPSLILPLQPCELQGCWN